MFITAVERGGGGVSGCKGASWEMGGAVMVTVGGQWWCIRGSWVCPGIEGGSRTRRMLNWVGEVSVLWVPPSPPRGWGVVSYGLGAGEGGAYG